MPPRLTQTELQRAQLESVGDRPIEASGPGSDPESLRRAYLDLLKLALCDLVGGRTLTVGRSGDGRGTDQPLYTRQLAENELPLRAIGADWPFSGLTMVGLSRLGDLQACVEEVVAGGVDGDLIECGAWRGGASILMRATLDTLGEDGRRVWVADSFEGLPKPDESFPEDRNLDLSWLDYLAVPREAVQANFKRFDLDHDVEFVEGFFEQTLPGLKGRTWALMRLDGDTYEATRIALESLYPGLSVGGHVVVDDYQLISECRQAVDDYREECGIDEPIEKIDDNAVRWRRRREEIAQPRRARAREVADTAPRSVDRGEPRRIPSVGELELRRRLDELRGSRR